MTTIKDVFEFIENIREKTDCDRIYFCSDKDLYLIRVEWQLPELASWETSFTKHEFGAIRKPEDILEHFLREAKKSHRYLSEHHEKDMDSRS